jgi:phosphatidylserine decarboxylase
MNSIIAREGWPFVGIALAFFIIAVAITNIPFLVITGLLALFVAWFFRNPERAIPEGVGLVTSPADGKIINIDNSNGQTKISIFMSVFNVHVNRIPTDGTIQKIDYNKGKFLVASKDKASLENEQNAVTMEDSRGRTIKFVQIAGLVARRIVCHIGAGDKVRRGERFGMIRFGSRMDVYLPGGFSCAVKVGDKVAGGSSILGNF